MRRTEQQAYKFLLRGSRLLTNIAVGGALTGSPRPAALSGSAEHAAARGPRNIRVVCVR